MPGWVDRQTARQTDSSKYLSARAWVATERGASCQSISRAGEKPSPAACPSPAAHPSPAARPSPHPSPRALRETGLGGNLVPSLQIPTRAHQLCPAASPTTAPAARGCKIPSPASASGCPTPALLLGTKSNLKAGRGLAQSHPPHGKGRHPPERGLGRAHSSCDNDCSNDILQESSEVPQGSLSYWLVYRSILSSTWTHCRSSKEPFIP